MDVYDARREQGAEVIQRVIADQPQDFLKVIAGLLPRQLEMRKPEEEMSDEELADAIGKLDALLAVARPTHGGSGSA